MDKRKNNGGNSTKSKGVDKRKNAYKDVLEDALTKDDIQSVVKMLFAKALEKDIPAAKIIMEYYLGKPLQTIDQNNTHIIEDFDIKKLYGEDKEAQ